MLIVDVQGLNSLHRIGVRRGRVPYPILDEPAQGSLPVRGVWLLSNLAGKGLGGAVVCVGISIARAPSYQICTHLRGQGLR